MEREQPIIKSSEVPQILFHIPDFFFAIPQFPTFLLNLSVHSIQPTLGSVPDLQQFVDFLVIILDKLGKETYSWGRVRREIREQGGNYTESVGGVFMGCSNLFLLGLFKYITLVRWDRNK